MQEEQTKSNSLDRFHDSQKSTLVAQLTNPDKIKLLLELYDKIHHMEEHILNLEWRILNLEKHKLETNI